MTNDYNWTLPHINNLKKDKDIVICPADKGNITVIMDRSDYNTKIADLLGDPAYEIIDHDPTKTIEHNIQQKLFNLHNSKRITHNTYQSLTPKHSSCPIFYGLPKVHKDNIPLRPICDFRHAPSFQLAHFLNKILKPITNQNSYSFKNSYDFAQDIKDIQIPDTHILISLDVKSLFTNVPINHTLAYINRQLHIHKDIWKPLTSLMKDIIELIQLCIASNYFKYNTTHYKQKSGTPMGSPISPVFAEFFMMSLEQSIVPNHEHIFYYKRYVDDTFLIITKNKTNDILTQFNNFHTKIYL